MEYFYTTYPKTPEKRAGNPNFWLRMHAPKGTPFGVTWPTSLAVKRPTRADIAQLQFAHARTQGNPFGVTWLSVTSGSHGTCTTLCISIVRKKRGKMKKGRKIPNSGWECAHPFGVTSLPVALSVMSNDTFCTIVMQNVPVAHAHAITSVTSDQGRWRYFRLHMHTPSLPVAPPHRPTTNVTWAAPIYY